MSKDKKQNQEPAIDETTETPEVETPTVTEKPSKTTYVCSACKHTTGVKLGAPYRNGEQTLQCIKCARCSNVSIDVLS